MDGMTPKACSVCGRVKATYLFQRGSDECDVCREFRLAAEREAQRVIDSAREREEAAKRVAKRALRK